MYLICISGMLINFFITPNPYSALHSGRTGYDADVFSTSFVIAPNYLILITLIISLFFMKYFVVEFKVIVLIVFLLLSACYNQLLLSDFTTYFYDALVLIFLFSISYNIKNGDGNFIGYKSVMPILTLFVFIGFILAVLFPNRYGYLPFEFSRTTRGQVTLWNVLGIYTLYPVLSIFMFVKYKKKFFILISLIMSVIILSTSSRAFFIISVTPFLIWLLFKIRIGFKNFFLIIISIVFLIFNKEIINFLKGYNSDSFDISKVSNGRFELWRFHADLFTENPLFGVGINYIGRTNFYDGSAVSEIGILSWFSEVGLLFGLTMILLLVCACVVSITLLINNKKIADNDFVFSLLYLSMLPNIIQDYNRVLSIDDMIFWISLFYLNKKIKSILPKVSISLRKKSGNRIFDYN